MHKIIIAGIGPGAPEYVAPAAYEAASRSDILVGGRRNLEIFQHLHKETYLYSARQEDMLSFVNEARKTKKVCVIVSGDPGFYSLLDFFLKRVGESELEVIPGISSFQYLFSRLAKPWKNYLLASMHGRQIDLKNKLAENAGLFLLTDRTNNPGVIAQALLENGAEDCTMYVGENLSYPDERIVRGRPEEILQKKFSDLCVVVIEKNDMGL